MVRFGITIGNWALGLILALVLMVWISSIESSTEGEKKSQTENQQKIETMFATAKKGDFVIIPGKGMTNVVVVFSEPYIEAVQNGKVSTLRVKAPRPYPAGLTLYEDTGTGVGFIHSFNLPKETFVINRKTNETSALMGRWDYWARKFVRQAVGIE